MIGDILLARLSRVCSVAERRDGLRKPKEKDMKIDLHIHSKDGSDGRWSLEEIFVEVAEKRHIDLISITDHDAIHAQEHALELAQSYGIQYLTGVELNVTFSHADYNGGKPVSLDFLGYQYDLHNPALLRN